MMLLNLLPRLSRNTPRPWRARTVAMVNVDANDASLLEETGALPENIIGTLERYDASQRNPDGYDEDAEFLLLRPRWYLVSDGRFAPDGWWDDEYFQ